LGEHTEYALKEILDLTDEEIEELVIEDVLR
jgi:crotonobetainyl-CoA:carnitine CoA-transferase CaiB-like acyl-CoA transferase